MSKQTTSGKFIATGLMTLAMGLLLLSFDVQARAQTGGVPVPSPSPTTAPSGGDQSDGLVGQMTSFIEAARALVPAIRRTVEKPVMSLVMTLSWVLASFVLALGFLRILKENNGGSTDVYFWTGRACFFLFLIGVSAYLVFYLVKAGNWLPIPLEKTTDTLEESFDTKYKEFTEAHFAIVDGKQEWVRPRVNGKAGLIGILYDKDKKIKDPDEAMKLSSWQMPQLFTILNFCRTLMEFADLFLILAGPFIIIGLRLAAPIMAALGIDQKLAHQTTYPYTWALLAFTLVYPLVREIIRIVGFTIGTIGLATFDGKPMYWMDDLTGQIVTVAGYEPSVTVLLAAFMMLVAALTMFMAPVIAYKLLKGQIFEAVSGVTGGWMATMVGSAVELYGLRAAAAINQQAGMISAEGQFRSESTRAGGQKEAADISARARQIVGTANAQGGLTASLHQIHGNETTQLMLNNATATFGKSSTSAGVQLSKADITARRDQAVQDAKIGQGRELATNEYMYRTGKMKQISSYFGPFGYWGNRSALRTETAAGNDVAVKTSEQTMGNETTTATQLSLNQTAYNRQMKTAYEQQQGANASGIKAGAGEAAAGATAGAGIAIKGINDGYKLDLEANKKVFDSTIEGAKISRGAQEESVRWQALSSVIAGFFRDVSRRIDDGLKPRY